MSVFVIFASISDPKQEFVSQISSTYLSFVCQSFCQAETGTCDAKHDDDEAHRNECFEWNRHYVYMLILSEQRRRSV